jgi:hypothetical protein
MVVACLSATLAEILSAVVSVGKLCLLSVWVRCSGGAVSAGEVQWKCCQCGWGAQEVLSVWVMCTVAATHGTIYVIVLKNSSASEFWTSVTDHRTFCAAPRRILTPVDLSVRNWRRGEATPLFVPPEQPGLVTLLRCEAVRQLTVAWQ